MFNVGLKIRQQLLQGYKGIGRFFAVQMPMVAFASLVVISHVANSLCTEIKAVLVPVRTRLQWFGDLPDHDFYNGAIVAYLFGFGKESCWHYLYCILAIYCINAI
jgi:hypothetical protein